MRHDNHLGLHWRELIASAYEARTLQTWDRHEAGTGDNDAVGPLNGCFPRHVDVRAEKVPLLIPRDVRGE